MQLVEDAVMKILGVRPAMFRPPYGNFNNDALATVASRNYTAVIIWDVISGASTSMSVQQSLSNYANAIKDGGSHIILQHEQDGDSFGQIYDQVFKELVAAKKQLVTVAQCLNMAPYLSTSKIGTRDVSTNPTGLRRMRLMYSPYSHRGHALVNLDQVNLEGSSTSTLYLVAVFLQY